MKQVQIHQYGGPEVLRIEEVEVPVPGDWELLIQVKYASANPKDVMLRKGKLKAYLSIAFPVTIGQDFSGIVTRVGKKVKDFRPGDEVFGMTNQHNNGTLSEFVKVIPEEIFHKPETLDFAASAAVPLAGQTALQALKREARLQPGQHVCINGASGGVGTFAIQIARLLGARVTAVSSHRNRQRCLDLGADQHIDYQEIPFSSHPEQYDVFFDVFGNQRYRTVKHLLKENGWYLTTVPNGPNIRDTLLSYLKLRKSRLVVVESDSADLALLKSWLDKGDLVPVVEAEFPMKSIVEVHRRLETKRTVGKIVVKVAD